MRGCGKPQLQRRLLFGLSVEDAQNKFSTPEGRANLQLAHERYNKGIYHELQHAQRLRQQLSSSQKLHITRHTKPSAKGFQAYATLTSEDFVVQELCWTRKRPRWESNAPTEEDGASLQRQEGEEGPAPPSANGMSPLSPPLHDGEAEAGGPSYSATFVSYAEDLSPHAPPPPSSPPNAGAATVPPRQAPFRPAASPDLSMDGDEEEAPLLVPVTEIGGREVMEMSSSLLPPRAVIEGVMGGKTNGKPSAAASTTHQEQEGGSQGGWDTARAHGEEGVGGEWMIGPCADVNLSDEADLDVSAATHLSSSLSEAEAPPPPPPPHPALASLLDTNASHPNGTTHPTPPFPPPTVSRPLPNGLVRFREEQQVLQRHLQVIFTALNDAQESMMEAIEEELGKKKLQHQAEGAAALFSSVLLRRRGGTAAATAAAAAAPASLLYSSDLMNLPYAEEEDGQFPPSSSGNGKEYFSRSATSSTSAAQEPEVPLVDRLVEEMVAAEESGYKPLSHLSSWFEPIQLRVILNEEELVDASSSSAGGESAEEEEELGAEDEYVTEDGEPLSKEAKEEVRAQRQAERREREANAKAIRDAFRSPHIVIPAMGDNVSFSLHVAGGLIRQEALIREFPYHIARFFVSNATRTARQAHAAAMAAADASASTFSSGKKKKKKKKLDTRSPSPPPPPPPPTAEVEVYFSAELYRVAKLIGMEGIRALREFIGEVMQAQHTPSPLSQSILLNPLPQKEASPSSSSSSSVEGHDTADDASQSRLDGSDAPSWAGVDLVARSMHPLRRTAIRIPWNPVMPLSGRGGLRSMPAAGEQWEGTVEAGDAAVEDRREGEETDVGTERKREAVQLLWRAWGHLVKDLHVHGDADYLYICVHQEQEKEETAAYIQGVKEWTCHASGTSLAPPSRAMTAAASSALPAVSPPWCLNGSRGSAAATTAAPSRTEGLSPRLSGSLSPLLRSPSRRGAVLPIPIPTDFTVIECVLEKCGLPHSVVMDDIEEMLQLWQEESATMMRLSLMDEWELQRLEEPIGATGKAVGVPPIPAAPLPSKLSSGNDGGGVVDDGALFPDLNVTSVEGEEPLSPPPSPEPSAAPPPPPPPSSPPLPSDPSLLPLVYAPRIVVSHAGIVERSTAHTFQRIRIRGSQLTHVRALAAALEAKEGTTPYWTDRQNGALPPGVRPRPLPLGEEGKKKREANRGGIEEGEAEEKEEEWTRCLPPNLHFSPYPSNASAFPPHRTPRGHNDGTEGRAREEARRGRSRDRNEVESGLPSASFSPMAEEGAGERGAESFSSSRGASPHRRHDPDGGALGSLVSAEEAEFCRTHYYRLRDIRLVYYDRIDAKDVLDPHSPRRQESISALESKQRGGEKFPNAEASMDSQWANKNEDDDIGDGEAAEEEDGKGGSLRRSSRRHLLKKGGKKSSLVSSSSSSSAGSSSFSAEQIYQQLCAAMEKDASRWDLSAGDCPGYQYWIRLRKIRKEEVPLAARALRSVQQKGFINYFTPHRFSSFTSMGRHPGLALLKGEYQAAASMMVQQVFVDAAMRSEKAHHLSSRSAFAPQLAFAKKGMALPSNPSLLQPRSLVLPDFPSIRGSAHYQAVLARSSPMIRILHNALQAAQWRSQADESRSGGSGGAILPASRSKGVGLVAKIPSAILPLPSRGEVEEGEGDVDDPCAEAFRCVLGPHACRLLIHEFLAFVWNDLVNQRIHRYGTFTILPGDLVRVPFALRDWLPASSIVDILPDYVDGLSRTPGRTGGEGSSAAPIFTLASRESIDQHRFHWSDVVLPVPGANMILPQNHTADLYVLSLKRYGIPFNPEKGCWELFYPKQNGAKRGGGGGGEAHTNRGMGHTGDVRTRNGNTLGFRIPAQYRSILVHPEEAPYHFSALLHPGVIGDPFQRWGHAIEHVFLQDLSAKGISDHSTSSTAQLSSSSLAMGSTRGTPMKALPSSSSFRTSFPYTSHAMAPTVLPFFTHTQPKRPDGLAKRRSSVSMPAFAVPLGKKESPRGTDTASMPTKRHRLLPLPSFPYWYPQHNDGALDVQIRLPTGVSPWMLLRELTKSDVDHADVVELQEEEVLEETRRRGEEALAAVAGSATAEKGPEWSSASSTEAEQWRKRQRRRVFQSRPVATSLALLHQHLFRSSGVRRSLLPTLRSYDSVSK